MTSGAVSSRNDANDIAVCIFGIVTVLIAITVRVWGLWSLSVSVLLRCVGWCGGVGVGVRVARSVVRYGVCVWTGHSARTGATCVTCAPLCAMWARMRVRNSTGDCRRI